MKTVIQSLPCGIYFVYRVDGFHELQREWKAQVIACGLVGVFHVCVCKWQINK